MTETQIARHNWYQQRYEPIALGILGLNYQTCDLGNRSNLVCRYCDKTAAETTFGEIAHAFPEQIGNKWLFDSSECNACNAHFGKRLDNDFGKWTMPWRTFGQVFGKKNKIPKYKSNDKTLRIEVDQKHDIQVKRRRDEPRITDDPINKTYSTDMLRQSYVPMGAFKCLAKMALAIMPADELARCSHLKNWILEPEHTDAGGALSVLVQQLAFATPAQSIAYSLARRKPGNETSPYMIFALQMAHWIFQINVPMEMEDALALAASADEHDVYPIPHFWSDSGFATLQGEGRIKNVDLTSFTARSDDIERIVMSYEAMEEVAPKPAL